MAINVSRIPCKRNAVPRCTNLKYGNKKRKYCYENSTPEIVYALFLKKKNVFLKEEKKVFLFFNYHPVYKDHHQRKPSQCLEHSQSQLFDCSHKYSDQTIGILASP